MDLQVNTDKLLPTYGLGGTVMPNKQPAAIITNLQSYRSVSRLLKVCTP